MSSSIVVDVAARRLTLVDGNGQRTFPVGVGKMLTPTPSGLYYIVSKVPNPGGPFGAMWLGLNRAHYGIHGTNNPGSIGKIVSHGCIRMYNKDVVSLSGAVTVGTPVRIINPL